MLQVQLQLQKEITALKLKLRLKDEELEILKEEAKAVENKTATLPVAEDGKMVGLHCVTKQVFILFIYSWCA